MCLRGKMADVGILPQAAVETPAAQTTEPATETAEAPSAPAEAPTDEPAAPEAADTEGLIAATFGLLRAEPDGSVVIAGSGEPGTDVEVFSNGELLGRTTVEPSGDWVLVPDAPIAPGGTEITLGEAGKEGQAKDSFVVVIDEDKSTEPLVVASTPGAISEVLQGLGRPQIATAPATTEAPAADAPASVAVADNTPAATDTSASAQPETAAALTTEPAAETAPAAAPETQVAVADTPDATPEPTPAEEPAAPVQANEPAADTPDAPEAQTAAVEAPAAEPTPAAAPANEPAPAVTADAPTIDAIEVEGDRTFFAGGAKEGSTVRLYVEDAFVADARTKDGRWLIEAGKVLTKPQQRVRIDVLEAGGSQVIARAEVNFVLDVPAAQPPVATAEAAPAQTPAATTEPTPVAAADTPATPAAAPAAATSVAPAADVPTMVAVAIGGSDAERFASGKAIIRRGDNLWTIARRVYGEGIKYTTIYQANTGQIRDPHRIYPGQVFDLPN